MTKTDTEAKKPRSWLRRIWSWTWQLGLLLLLYLAVTTWMTRSLLSTGTPAPAWALVDMQGKTHTLQQYRGKRVVLHFWATWCAVCKTNIPMLRYLASSYRHDPVLLSVVQDGHNVAEIQRIQKAKGIQYPILRANAGMIATYQVSQYPTTYFLDTKGRISSKDVGLITPFGFWMRITLMSIQRWLGI